MVNGRWLKMKKIVFGLFLLMNLVSCTSQQLDSTSTPTSTPLPSATFTLSPTSREDSFPPKETPKSITPVAFDVNTQNISDVIDSTYNVPLACRLDWLDPSDNEPPYNATPDPKGSPRKLDFVDITKQADLEKVWIRQIVDAPNKKYRAYLVEEPLPDKCDSCIRSAIYVENLPNNHIYHIEFEGFLPYRVL